MGIRAVVFKDMYARKNLLARDWRAMLLNKREGHHYFYISYVFRLYFYRNIAYPGIEIPSGDKTFKDFYFEDPADVDKCMDDPHFIRAAAEAGYFVRADGSLEIIEVVQQLSREVASNMSKHTAAFSNILKPAEKFCSGLGGYRAMLEIGHAYVNSSYYQEVTDINEIYLGFRKHHFNFESRPRQVKEFYLDPKKY